MILSCAASDDETTPVRKNIMRKSTILVKTRIFIVYSSNFTTLLLFQIAYHLENLVGCLYRFSIHFISPLGRNHINHLFNNVDIRHLDGILLDGAKPCDTRASRYSRSGSVRYVVKLFPILFRPEGLIKRAS